MPVVKGGVWTNIEDEILKAAVSKYGLNQWARVSSLLARKTPKQCKARWTEWLDPGIRKTEWSREEDEKLLHLAKLMPTQWRTIAPIVGRTATQCLERYQKLLDEAEARENQELAFAGQDGGETAAPSADDVRRLRPGELDPDPESKPARPDTIDLDEDEKEMLSEARARLANTQGKKAKRKARERQLEESRRLAVLQKRRELKSAGINVKVTTRKKGQMDYNADIPFEKAPAPGFFDTQDEQEMNERQREQFDPRKQQLASKRKGDQQDEQGQDNKRRKNDKDGSAGAAAARAAQLQRIREAEQSSKRRALVLPSPQVSEGELEDIVKMGISGERAGLSSGDGGATQGLVGNYSSTIGATPIRTPRAQQGEDRIANELRNARARTDTQSALLGGDNTILAEGDGTTGYGGVLPSKQTLSTPNPLATPLYHSNGGPSATPLRTPRDNYRLNKDDGSMSLMGQTPRDARMLELANRGSLRNKLASLPKPQQSEFELEAMPEEQDEHGAVVADESIEDATTRDKRIAEAALAAELAAFRRRTRVVQKGLPRPKMFDMTTMLANARSITDPVQRSIAEEATLLMAHDANGNVPLRAFDDGALRKAQMELEMGQTADRELFVKSFNDQLALPGNEMEMDGQLLTTAWDDISQSISTSSESGYALEKKLAKLHGGYAERQKKLRAKITEASEALAKTRLDIETARHAQVAEDAAITGRLESLRDEVALVSRKEREAQETYRTRKEELELLTAEA